MTNSALHHAEVSRRYASGTEAEIAEAGGTGKSAKEYAESVNPENYTDRDLSNLSKIGKETSANLAMPSDVYIDLDYGHLEIFTNTLGDGFLSIDSESGKQCGIFQVISDISNPVLGCFSPPITSHKNTITLAVRKGNKYYFNYTGSPTFKRFIYAEGSQP